MSGNVAEWLPLTKLYPVHGAATAFFRGKFWVFGGSTGDDAYDDTITDKVTIIFNLHFGHLERGVLG